MKLRQLRGAWRILPALCLGISAISGCGHGDKDWEPLTEQKIYVSDRFFDVAVLSEQRAIVVGYNGKILETENSGVTWTPIDTGEKDALYRIDFADERNGWISGQGGVLLKTADGGKTWKKQGDGIWMTDECRETKGGDDPTECPLAPLFSLTAIDAKTAVAVGDRSVITMTSDGGETWRTSTLEPEGLELLDLNSLLAFEDPVLYDVLFFDAQTGFVVGEFGKIYKTINGGKTWIEKQASLVGADYFDVLDLPTFFDIEFLNRSVGYAVGLEARVAKTTDGGETWAWVEHGVEEYSAPFYASAVLPNGTVFVVGASGQFVSTLDSGKLAQGHFGSQVNNWVRRVEFYDDKNGWVVGGFGFIMNTTDGGNTWFRRMG